MIVREVRELGVDLARRRMQERRARRGSFLKGMCPCSPV
jgi:hypothetical protein